MIFLIVKRSAAALILGFAAAVTAETLFGADENAEYFFSAGLLKSVEKDLSGAIEAFEKSYELKKQEVTKESLVDAEDIKESLIEVLMAKGKSELAAKRNSNALQCFDRILVLEPENSEAKKLKSPIIIKKKTGILTEKKKERKVAKRALKVKPPAKKVLPHHPPQKKEPEVGPVKSPLNPIPAEKKPSKINMWFSAGIILIFFITFFSYSKRRKKPPETQEVIPPAKQKIQVPPPHGEKTASKILLDSPPAAKQKIAALPAKNYIHDGTTRAMLENPNSHVRARGVELIAEELRGAPAEIIERILVPCLSDSDSRVRANAAKALYEYNPEIAMNALRAMAHYSSKWMRLSAEWAFEKIGSPEAIEHLLSLAHDTETSIRSKAVKYLKRFYMEKKVPENLMQKLKEVLDGDGPVV
ncbi:MAG: HEAT repeat domain-containing protein [bacterium]